MEFFIRKNSLEPILKMQVVQDGRNDFNSFHDKLANSSIYFSMKDVKTGIPKILNANANIVAKTPTSVNAPTEYYIYYKWKSRDVNKVGRFEYDMILLENGEIYLYNITTDKLRKIHYKMIQNKTRKRKR